MKIAAALGVCMLSVLNAWAEGAARLNPDAVCNAKSSIVLAGPAGAAGNLKLDRDWGGALCRSRLLNTGSAPAAIKEIVLFSIPHELPGDTPMYGEGFTMLSQTGGTISTPTDIGCLTDVGHYKIPKPDDATVAYGLLELSPPDAPHYVFAFTSCRRFVGKSYVRAHSIDVVIDAEGLAIGPGESWDLEEFMFASGPDSPRLLDDLAERINVNQPRLAFAQPPAGWCSWYCFGPAVTSRGVMNNLDVIESKIPQLRYIQIDDGYQPAMGDWLDTGKAFGGDVKGVIQQIRDRGFEPAIWVAPFIAEENSRLFKEHPDWFIMDADGKPLRADKVTFGGWRNGPWYAVDGTHPEAQKHLEEVFRTLRNEWGCTYFKLDANFWGAMHGGRFHDAKATRVEAYRRGMEAVLRGAGNAFILGCNHPIWPSFGLIHGSRSSMDIDRSWNSFQHIAFENFHRNWQNGHLWWNDPDCVVLTGKLSDDEFRVHASAILATGGMVLSGDNLTRLDPKRLAMLAKLAPSHGVAAAFADNSYRVGEIPGDKTWMVCAFNWGEEPQTVKFTVSEPCTMKDFWTEEDLGRCDASYEIKDMPRHSAKVIACTPAK